MSNSTFKETNQTNYFKLIAIRPLPKCDIRFSKILKRGLTYRLFDHQHYHFNEDQKTGEVHSIKKSHVAVPDLYSPVGKAFKGSISVSAIVGKNGSGKSTLLELLFATAFMVAVNNNVIEPNDQSLRERLKKKNLINEDELRKELSEIELMRGQLQVEIFFEIDTIIYRVRLDGKSKEQIDQIKQGSDSWNEVKRDEWKGTITNFFYSIAVNYSVHGLNAKHSGKWVDRLFHKNDGYRTPVVINPFRINGNIDVNTENHLAQSRLLSNLLGSANASRNILKDYQVDSITFEYKKGSADVFMGRRTNDIISDLLTRYKLDRPSLLTLIAKTFIAKDLNYKKIQTSQNFKAVERYLIKKLFKIASHYPEYKDFYKEPVGKGSKFTPSLNSFEQYLIALKDDDSHITLKIKQALNTIDNNLLSPFYKKKIFWKNEKLILSVDELRSRINDIKGIDTSGDLTPYIPAAFYIPELTVSRAGHINQLHFLSSGQLQMIHVIQSIVYHLKNLNSVFNSKKGEKICYENINIILDEIELYFHPEYQKDFLTELIYAISNCTLPSIKSINIIFSTHSPFILSDIPRSNILFLQENGEPSPDLEMSTFGGNIHDMLRHSFFLSEGTMGTLSRTWIEKTISFLNSKLRATQTALASNKGKDDQGQTLDEVSSRAIIEIIDEPVLKRKLLEMHDQAFNADFELDFIKAQIEKFRKEEQRVLKKRREQQ